MSTNLKIFKDKKISRRSFFGVAGSAALLGACYKFTAPYEFIAKNIFNQHPGTLIIGDEDAPDESRLVNGSQSKFLVALNLETKKRIEFPVPCLAHSIVGHPLEPYRLFLMPQMYGVACEVDLRSKSVVQVLNASKGLLFYGHGAYSNDGKHLFTVEADAGKENGCIHVRDAETLKILSKIESFGIGPHDFKIIDSGKTIIVANSGYARADSQDYRSDASKVFLDSNIAFIELQTGKLIEKFDAKYPDAMVGHFDIAKDRSLAVTFTPTENDLQGPIMMRSNGSKLELASNSERIYKAMIGQALSVKIFNPTLTAGVTSPYSNLVTFWDLRKKSLIKTFNFVSPKGITLTQDERYFVVSTTSRQTFFISTRSLELDNDAFSGTISGNSAHLLSWKHLDLG